MDASLLLFIGSCHAPCAELVDGVFVPMLPTPPGGWRALSALYAEVKEPLPGGRVPEPEVPLDSYPPIKPVGWAPEPTGPIR